MRKFVIFICGMIVGSVLTIGVLYFIKDTADSGLVLFEQDEGVIDGSIVKIIQTLDSQHALAYVGNDEYLYNDLLVLLIGNDTSVFYDDMVINLYDRERIVRVGTYKYETVEKRIKTIPAVSIKQ